MRLNLAIMLYLATLMLLAVQVPALMMLPYSASTASVTSGVLPLVIFLMVVKRCSLSPGLIRSGL